MEDTSAVPESRAVVSRLQRQMLVLLPHYCISDLQQHQHRLRLAASAAVAASDPATAACAGSPTDLDDTVAQMEMNIYDTLSNVITLCSSLVTKSGKMTSLSVCLLSRCRLPLSAITLWSVVIFLRLDIWSLLSFITNFLFIPIKVKVNIDLYSALSWEPHL